MRTTLTAALLTLFIAAPMSAQAPRLSERAQVVSAVAPLPQQFRADATVLGYQANSAALSVLRQGSGAFVCLASNPSSEDRFHVACYHRDLEPFMARGREIRARGPENVNVDSIRFAEARAGTLRLPSQAAALYSITGTHANVAADGAVSGGRAVYVVYVPYATAESTGLPTVPQPNAPWLMNPGTPKAHIMFLPTM